MKTIAVYNIKGGVGKTTTAVNLSYLAARSGQRTLLWDLDPQGASSFAYRIRPHVSAFGKRSLADGITLSAAIKQTDYDNLCLLPADFAYRKLDRWLDALGHPDHLLASILDRIGRDFDVVVLDCPAGYSQLTETTLAVADAILTPTVPTVLSLRMVVRLIKQALRSKVRAPLALFFNMVDRRKTLHCRASELAATRGGMFLASQVPYASIVEQLAARRMPTAVYAPHAAATRAFADIWNELQTRLHQEDGCSDERTWAQALQGIEWLIDQLETVPNVHEQRRQEDGPDVIHRFDTEQRDLERGGCALELCERSGGEFVIVARSNAADATAAGCAEAQIDRVWTVQILSGEMSPLQALERRLGSPQPGAIGLIRAAAGVRALRRVDTRSTGTPASAHSVRKAITGSILVARRAGSHAAHSATSSSVTDNAR